MEFEGEYLNGERNGKGKEYYYNGELKFEGEYLDGKRHGKGKEYYDNGELKFEGEYFRDQRISFLSNSKKDNFTKFNKKKINI